MGRIYRVPFVAATVAAASGNVDLWELMPADDKPIHLVGFRLGQISEVGDTPEEGIDITIVHMTATVTGSNGTAVTPVPVDPGITDLAAGFTAEVNGATVATTSGATTVMEALGWINRNSPFEVWYPDIRMAPMARQASGLFIRMNTTIADDMTFVGTAFVEED